MAPIGIEFLIFSSTDTLTKDYYYGQLFEGLKHGKGLQILPNGNLYEGWFAKDKPDGMGRLLKPKGHYLGMFKQGT